MNAAFSLVSLSDPPVVSLFDIRRRFIAPLSPRIDTGDLPLAAVLVPIVQVGSHLSLLLTRRADHLRDHPGQISFPGGLFAEDDGSPQTTALREAREEIALESALVEIIGTLPALTTRSGFHVLPQVGLVSKPFAQLSLAANPAEVAEIFHLPLTCLFDPAVFCEMEYQGRLRRVYRWHSHVIWGATASILQSLASALTSP